MKRELNKCPICRVKMEMWYSIDRKSRYECPNCGHKEDSMKICPKCGKNKPPSDYYDYDTGGNKLTYWCKDCIKHYIEHTSVGAN